MHYYFMCRDQALLSALYQAWDSGSFCAPEPVVPLDLILNRQQNIEEQQLFSLPYSSGEDSAVIVFIK